FPAAWLKDALDDASKTFTARAGGKITVSYAASSALIKQIELGAPVDVFISADADWMDYGAQHKLIQDASRVDLLGNSLVLIAPKDSSIDRVAPGRNRSRPNSQVRAGLSRPMCGRCRPANTPRKRWKDWASGRPWKRNLP